MTIKFPVLVLISSAALALATAGALLAQAPAGKTTNDGVFTDAQVKKGSDLYQQQCAACHDAQLTGSGTAPALTGRTKPWARCSNASARRCPPTTPAA